MNLMGRKGDDLANINKWVKEATEGKIEDFLSELSDDTVLLLLNAIHFQGAFLLFSDSPILEILPLPCRLSWLCSLCPGGPSSSSGPGQEARSPLVVTWGRLRDRLWSGREEAQELGGAAVERVP